MDIHTKLSDLRGGDVVYVAVFIFLVVISGFARPGEKELSMLDMTIAVAAVIFLFQDIRRHRQDISIWMNACVVTIFFALLLPFLWLTTFLPNFVSEATEWYRNFGAALVILCLREAIVEEIVFRRYAQLELQRYMSRNWAIVASALIYTFWHRFQFASYELFLAGIAFGVLATHYESIHASILIHATTKALEVISPYLNGTAIEPGITSEIVLYGGATLAELIALVLLFSSIAIRALYRIWKKSLA